MFRLCLALVLACACVETVFAQAQHSIIHREWEFTGFGGGSFVPGNFGFPTSVIGNGQRTVRMDYGSGYQVGFRVGEHLGEYWGADLEYSFANQPLTFRNLSPTIPSLSVGQSVHHFNYSISYLPLPRTSRLRPYAKLGTGAALFDIHGNSRDAALAQGVSLRDSWKFLFNWGGGVKYLAGDQVALAFDVKDNLTGVPSYGLPSSAQIVNGQFFPGMANKGIMQNWQLNFGVTFQWDEE